jgi:hypothetical protein
MVYFFATGEYSVGCCSILDRSITMKTFRMKQLLARRASEMPIHPRFNALDVKSMMASRHGKTRIDRRVADFAKLN